MHLRLNSFFEFRLKFFNKNKKPLPLSKGQGLAELKGEYLLFNEHHLFNAGK